MGNGGLIGSPLARPYLHFAYNFIVVVPMVCALVDQTKHVIDRHPAPRGPQGAGPSRRERVLPSPAPDNRRPGQR